MNTPTIDQQAVILKGIASQILQMNKPSFEVVAGLFTQFDYALNNYVNIDNLVKEVESGRKLTAIHMESIKSLQTALNEERQNGYSGEFVHETLLAMIQLSNPQEFIKGRTFGDKVHTVKHLAQKLEEADNLSAHRLTNLIFEDKNAE